jgi:hypothetical protein
MEPLWSFASRRPLLCLTSPADDVEAGRAATWDISGAGVCEPVVPGQRHHASPSPGESHSPRGTGSALHDQQDLAWPQPRAEVCATGGHRIPK